MRASWILRAVAGGAILLLTFGASLANAFEKADRAVESSAPPRGAPNSIMIFGGRGTDTNFTQSVYAPWTINFVDLSFVGGAASTRLGTMNDFAHELGHDLGMIGDEFTIEGELGAGYHFGDETMGEFWSALYLRYDGFPWNDHIYTTLAANIGVSLLTQESDFERSRDANSDGEDGNASRFLHHFSPEITVADPDNKNLELVLRLQHRSGIFGLIDGITSGSTFITTGVRVRF